MTDKVAMDVRLSGRIVLRLGDAAEARAALEALAPENQDHLSAHTDGDLLVLELPEGPLATGQHTIDDALACLNAALGSVAVTEDDDLDMGAPAD